jgi:sirohydrochlorin cobaltochelatase
MLMANVTADSKMRPDRALLIAGHGSTVNSDSSAPTLRHAAEIRRRGIFAEVACAFWKEEPSFRDARFLFDPAEIREVYVVPNFISEGYFTQTVIPRELELNGACTVRADGQRWNYCQPVGSNPSMTDILVRRAREIAPDAPASETSLLIVAHGTDQNENSAVAAKREAEAIRAKGEYAAVISTYMEEPPLVSEWQKLASTTHVVVVPFFISDGLHSYEDIPVLLGIAQKEIKGGAGAIFGRNPFRFGERFLYYARSIGSEPAMAELILQQVESFDGATRARKE